MKIRRTRETQPPLARYSPMPINRVDPDGQPMSAAEFRAESVADRKKAMADYIAQQAAVDARTAELRRQRLTSKAGSAAKTAAKGRKKRRRVEEQRPDLFAAGKPVKRRIGI